MMTDQLSRNNLEKHSLAVIFEFFHMAFGGGYFLRDHEKEGNAFCHSC
jgi:hypothetical protein